MERAKSRTLLGYVERHHIIPKCMNGTDVFENIVELTAREHFVAHILLVKMYPEQRGLIHAVNLMTRGHGDNRIHNRMYGWLKEKFAREMSISQSGDGNSQYGTMWIHNVLLEKSKKIQYNEHIPIGWNKGRVLDF